MTSFLGEIKRRKVFQVAAVYAVVSWLIIQIVDVIGDPLSLPPWLDTVVIILLAAGFPIAVILAWAFDLTSHGIKTDAEVRTAGTAPRSPGQGVTFGIQILVLVAVGFLVVDQYLLEPRAGSASATSAGTVDMSGAVDRFDYELPEGRSFRSMNRRVIAVSPDGRSFVYNAADGFYLRRMDELEARLIPGTEAPEAAAFGTRASTPAFSPDGQAVAYYDTESRRLVRVALNGGPPVPISEIGREPTSISWERDGTILYADFGGIHRISEDGGTPERIVTMTEGLVTYGPSLLSDGDTLLFSMGSRGSSDAVQVVAQSLSTGERATLVESGGAARYLPTGHLVYVLGDTLFGIAFDTGTLTVSGSAVPLVQGVMRLGGVFSSAGGANQLAQFDIAEDGTLAYVTETAAESRRSLVWVDRTGQEEAIPVDPGGYVYPRISPDGTRVALDERGANNAIWVHHFAGGTTMRLATSDLGGQYPIWSLDSVRIAFQSVGTRNIDWSAANNTGTTERLATLLDQVSTNVFPFFFSPSGMSLVFRSRSSSQSIDIGMVAIDNDSEAVWLLQEPYTETNAELSLDGRWMAYQSNESGRFQIYVSPFPNVDGDKQLVSNAGGERPLWSRDGSELFYLEPGPPVRMISVAVETSETTFSYDPDRRPIFDPWPYRGLGTPAGRPYDVSRDGERFLAIKDGGADGATPQIIIVQNWFEDVRRLIPTE